LGSCSASLHLARDHSRVFDSRANHSRPADLRGHDGNDGVYGILNLAGDGCGGHGRGRSSCELVYEVCGNECLVCGFV
jgi:hypothetical protein